MAMLKVLQFTSPTELQSYLLSLEGSNFCKWASSQFHELYQELIDGESQLIEKTDLKGLQNKLHTDHQRNFEEKTLRSILRNEDIAPPEILALKQKFSTVMRMCTVCKLYIHYPEKTGLVLSETHRMLPNNTIIPKEQKDSLGGISEKARPGELPIDTVIRCLDEELGLKNYQRFIAEPTYIGNNVEIEESYKYPHLTTVYLLEAFSTTMFDLTCCKNMYFEELRPDGHIGIFTWRKAMEHKATVFSFNKPQHTIALQLEQGHDSQKITTDTRREYA